MWEKAKTRPAATQTNGGAGVPFPEVRASFQKVCIVLRTFCASVAKVSLTSFQTELQFCLLRGFSPVGFTAFFVSDFQKYLTSRCNAHIQGKECFSC